MKLHHVILLLLATIPSAGCELAGDLIEFGFWTAIIIVVLIVVVIAWVLKRIRGPRRP